MCRRCVEGYDHHCDWLNTCIGKGNYKRYLAFISVLWLYEVMVVIVAVDQLIKIGECALPRTRVAQGLEVCLATISLIFLAPLTHLVISQIRNLCQNKTTYQRAKEGHENLESSSDNEEVEVD